MQSYELEAGPRDVFCDEDDSARPAVQMPTMIGENNESVSERVPRCAIEIADIFLPVTKHGDERTASQLVDLLPNTSFDSIMLRRYIKLFVDSEDDTTRNA